MPQLTRQRLFPAATSIIFVVILAMVLVIYSTRVNVGVSPDSILYIQYVRSLSAGQGLTALNDQGQKQPMTQFPPLFPAVMSLSSVLSIDPLVFGRWLNALLCAVNAAFVMALTYRQTRHMWGTFFAGAFFATFETGLHLHVMLWSEPLFLAGTLLFVYAMSAYLDSGRLWLIILAGAAAGAPFLTRYLGAAVIGAGGLICLLSLATDTDKKWKHAIAFVVAAAAGPSVWLLRNALAAGSLTSRSAAFHPPRVDEVMDGLGSLCRLFPVPYRFPTLCLAAGACALALLLVGSYLLLARRSPGTHLAQRAPVLLVLLTTFVCYLLMLLVSKSLFDVVIPFDGRLLGPAATLLIPAIVIAYLRVSRPAVNVPRRHIIYIVIPVLVLLASAARMVPGVQNWSQKGVEGFADPGWRASQCVAQWRQLDSDLVSYTNGDGIIYLYTQRHVCVVPRKYDPTSNQRLPEYETQLATMKRQVFSGKAVVVWFDKLVGRDSLISKKELEDLFPDKIVNLSDGTLFGQSPVHPNASDQR